MATRFPDHPGNDDKRRRSKRPWRERQGHRRLRTRDFLETEADRIDRRWPRGGAARIPFVIAAGAPANARALQPAARAMPSPIAAGGRLPSPSKILWAVMGFALPLMFVTGTIMWWNRVILRS